MERVFGSMGQFAHFLEGLALTAELPVIEAARATSHVLYEHVYKNFGDVSKLQPLAQSTMDERTALGFSADEPLLRDGKLLRASVERFHELLIAAVGSSEPIMRYHEDGYTTQHGAVVPARPVFEIAMNEMGPEIEAILEIAAGAILGAPKSRELLIDTGLTAIVP
jgi:hypothetical protein